MVYDWPRPGPIDLAIHDLPHSSSTTEWWYVNGHLSTVGGGRWSVFAAFFRAVLGERRADAEPVYAHSLVCGLVDREKGRTLSCTLLDPRTPAEALRIMDEDDTGDPRMHKALREVFAEGSVPLPDQLLPRDGVVHSKRLDLDYGGNRFVKLVDGSYRLVLTPPDGRFQCDIVFAPEKPAVRHGDRGVVRGYSAESMFYYFIPRCRLRGSVTVEGRPVDIDCGDGWYDHEFGCHQKDESNGAPSPSSSVSWNWVAAQLDNGCDVTAYDVFDSANAGQSVGRWAIVVDPGGGRSQYDDFRFEATRWWTSVRTFKAYPVAWLLEIPAAGIALEIASEPENQEVVTLLSPPAFWESCVSVAGRFQEAKVTGRGFVERTGFEDHGSLDEFYRAVSRVTLQAVDRLLPYQPTPQQALNLVAGNDFESCLEGLDVGQFVDNLIVPLRTIVERGGKSWRSLGTLLSLELVGGDPNGCLELLALPELVHSGSLIVDDIQDQSSTRRGGPACHELFGVPLAMNAGVGAYFLGETLLQKQLVVDQAQKLRIYSLYFQAMRAGHTGQALDLSGVGEIVDEAVASGDGRALERRVLATHRLKSAIPASALARVGAIIGAGSEPEVEALGKYFEMLGLAFQVMDDVINLRGFDNNLKCRGEDITEGKVTMPVARAMSLLPPSGRRELWDRISAKPRDRAGIDDVIDKIERSGALEACERYAHALMEDAWRDFAPLFPDSYAKIKLRAYSFYILRAQY